MYPELLYKGQYTLKRVLTMPMVPSLTKDDIGKLVSLDSTGTVRLALEDAVFFGVLRTVNNNDNICTVDFSGVHQFKSTAGIDAGKAVVPGGTPENVKEGTGATKAVTLTQVAAGELVSVFFLN